MLLQSLPFGVRKNSTWYCVKTASLQLFENISSRAIIPLWHGIRFVRTPLPDDDGEKERVHHQKYYENFLIPNLKYFLLYLFLLFSSAHWYRKDIKYLTWFDRVAVSFSKILNTHVLEINLKELTDYYIQTMENCK